jgi:hypothetical protein
VRWTGVPVLLDGRTGPRSPREQQRQAAQRDPRQDGRAAGCVCHADRVAEDHDAGGRADERFQVHERAGDLGRDPRLPVREERERRKRARERQSDGGQQDARAAGRSRGALGDRGDGQGGERRREELHGGHGDRVAAGQQPGLRHGERSRGDQRRQDQAVAGEGRAAAPAGGDETDADERHREAHPGHRVRHPAVPYGRDDRDQHGRGADEQGRMAHARARDPGVLHQDRPAVPQRAPREHGRAARGTDPEPDGGEEHGGGQAEPRDGEPARRQPLEGQLGHGHGGTPQQARGGERCDGGTAVKVHGAIVTQTGTTFADHGVLRNNQS